jgi:o-succinylbenzoate---CoA ligase
MGDGRWEEVSNLMSDRVYELFSQRIRSGWLTNHLTAAQSDRLLQRAEQKSLELTQSQPNFIAIATPDPIEFIAELMAGSRLGLAIFLVNPDWGTSELEQFAKLTANVDRLRHQHQIMIPTGGSSGQLKFAMHTWETLSASVWGFQAFYQVEKINSVCVLPLYHVSGLMQLIRSLLTDGKLFITDFQQLCIDRTSPIARIGLANYFISLVPTQLHKLLDLDSHWLAGFQTILLGGAPPSIDLLERARLARLPLALTYGMTETGSQITSLNPAEFLAGNHSCGRVLPHAKIQIGSAVANQIGAIEIEAKSLMLGYFPDLNSAPYFEPDDLGTIDELGYLTIIGRSSGKIVTGGENVLPIEVVDVIMATKLVSDVWVVGLPDPYWGQKVTAVYVQIDPQITAQMLTIAITGKISKYKIPKVWIPVAEIPRNSLGKVSIPQVEALAARFKSFGG